ncbi:protein SPA1-RELATED 2-like [Impatiens glandulifera]|uniref:protein SPA1-RELATED 2-like n=1 Tax=Impatiens glandulifera TaxID=253017 RepID=UPI001FB18931|nr:protein SPA1-RELATED 2-like [Impatiens glandulifera]
MDRVREDVDALEGDFTWKADSSNMLESHAEHTGRKTLDAVSVSEDPYSVISTMDGTGLMVEELTVRKHERENMIVGSSKNKDVIQPKQIQRSSGNFAGDASNKGTPSFWEEPGFTVFSDYLNKQPLADQNSESAEQIPNDEKIPVSSDMVISPGGIRTKILSKSGFSDFFMKSTLKGKGVICKGPTREDVPKVRDQANPVAPKADTMSSNSQLSAKVTYPTHCHHDLNVGPSLREWLKDGHYRAKKMESMYIFRQIVEFVDHSHLRGVVVSDLRPSCFKLLPGNQAAYVGPSAAAPLSGYRNDKRPLEQAVITSVSQWTKRQKQREDLNLIRIGQQDSVNRSIENIEVRRGRKSDSSPTIPLGFRTLESMPSYENDQLEEKWYASPEELSGRECTFSSNIYALGVLLFELLGSFASERACAAAMLDLRNRILPPNFLAENLKEAGFCLWLLHPEPSSRPATREVLQSDLMNGIQELQKEELSSSFEQDDAESELLLHFLVSVKEKKQKDASKLAEVIKCLEADIEEVGRRNSNWSADDFSKIDLKSIHNELSNVEAHPRLQNLTGKDSKLMKSMDKLEKAYYSMRSSIQYSNTDMTIRANKELLTSRENWYRGQDHEARSNLDCLGTFFDGFLKFARYSKFQVRGVLRNGKFSNSANVICSLGFDRDQEYFAAAGVSKKIKIYEFEKLFNDTVDIHYPLLEMPNKSRISCISWNGYIKNYLASTDYDGIVKLWDAGTGQGISQYIEHYRRAWSLDFCHTDPTKLASGSDDCSVKIWNINERKSLSTIRNIANVCCVQFSAHSTHLLAFGSSDYKIYCYDLRKISSPWCILAGHDKAVSYVKFLDSETLVSASTDSSLKLWDLSKTSSSGSLNSACISTLKGHTNEKNFVGLSVADGFIACGSETNEVYTYCRSLPMPIVTHKFGSVDPVSGRETDDDNGQFVSSVCWRKNSDMMIAANSTGSIKVLQMV